MILDSEDPSILQNLHVLLSRHQLPGIIVHQGVELIIGCLLPLLGVFTLHCLLKRIRLHEFTQEAQAECEDTGSSQPPATKRPDVETEVSSSATSPERQRTSTCTALREYTGPKGSRSKDAPVARSGRVSKPPTWFGDYVYVAYENTNPDEEIGSLPPGWKKARAEVQHALTHELILAWWEDYCCLSTLPRLRRWWSRGSLVWWRQCR
jgi:hypothetical protein